MWGNSFGYEVLTGPVRTEQTEGSLLANVYGPLWICTKSVLVLEAGWEKKMMEVFPDEGVGS